MTTGDCNTCRHSRLALRGSLHCAHPENCMDMLTGEPEMHPCHRARHHMFGICGPDASLYDPIPEPTPAPAPAPLTPWQRFKAFARRAWPW